jgi:carboxyl-terminal processing protease
MGKRQGRQNFSITVRRAAYLFAIYLLAACLNLHVRAQDMKIQIARGQEMLDEIKQDIKKHYFDSNFRGINLDAHFAQADHQIEKAVSGDQIYGIIANALLAFNDSHTYFIPPTWSILVEYGWDMQMIGEKCYVTGVERGSDAQRKGVKPGDTVLSIFDVPVTRDNLWQLKYLFYRLRPVKAMTVTLQSSGGRRQRLELQTYWSPATEGTVSRERAAQRLSVQYYKEEGDELFLWKMPEFDLPDKGVDDMMKKVGGHKALILDLRGNGGGYEATLQYLMGYFFDRDVKLGDRKGRKESKPIVAKTQGDKVYKGKLVVLVDSHTASAAEVLARVVQLEKRGTVIGDRTAGAVTEARHFTHDYNRSEGFFISARPVSYAVSVTINNFVMADGQSLEGVGVTPDETVLPTPADLESGNDPVLLRAAELVGVKIDLKKEKPVHF